MAVEKLAVKIGRISRSKVGDDSAAWSVAANKKMPHIQAVGFLSSSRITDAPVIVASVGVSSRPPCGYVKRAWSSPSVCRSVACRIGNAHPVDRGFVPESPLSPWTNPLLNPPPANQRLNALRLWSRPSEFWVVGRRPNSPAHITSVLSRSPRLFRSLRARPKAHRSSRTVGADPA